MDQTRATPNGGFTLIEIVVTVAVVAITIASGIGISLASRSFAVAAAAAEFDHLLDSARTIARETEGATLVFTPDAFGDGTEVRVLAPGPNATLVATTLPVLRTHSVIEETQSLGKSPFAFVVHASGALGGRPGYHLGDSTATGEVGCPASGSFHFVIHTAGTSADRFIPCHITLAATGPVTLTAWPPATVAPAPTPCSAGCTPATLPTPPSNAPSCPPNYAVTPTGCTPNSPPTSATPRYHVTASLASPTMTVGGTDTITAQATLTNPTTAPPGTPASVPVIIETQPETVCTAVSSGRQSPESPMILTGTSIGTCLVTLLGDVSQVLAAVSDTTSLTAQVIPAPSAIPSPLLCDTFRDGRCYRKIVDHAAQAFWKYVMPDSRCGNVAGVDTCWYIDSVKDRYLIPGFGFQIPNAAADGADALLFQIDMIRTVYNRCKPFSFFATVPVGTPIQWGGSGTGTPVDAVPGWGEPSIYLTVNHVIADPSPNGTFDISDQPWEARTTLAELYAAVALQSVGTPYVFTNNILVPSTSFVQWYPDFPGCDAAGDSNTPPVEYGVSGVELVFDIFQAAP